MDVKVKVQSTIDLEYKVIGDLPSGILRGLMTMHFGRGHKKETVEFIWNLGCDTRPRITNKSYNATETDQLKHIITYYINKNQGGC